MFVCLHVSFYNAEPKPLLPPRSLFKKRFCLKFWTRGALTEMKNLEFWLSLFFFLLCCFNSCLFLLHPTLGHSSALTITRALAPVSAIVRPRWDNDPSLSAPQACEDVNWQGGHVLALLPNMGIVSAN